MGPKRGRVPDGRRHIGRKLSTGAVMFFSVVRLVILILPSAAQAASVGPDEIVRNMEAAWSKVEDYRMRVEVTTFAKDGSASMEKFLYGFKKPGMIRLDFREPHPGMTVIYPDKEGKVFVRPSGLLRLFTLHLSLESRLLAVSSGQRIDQTDMGLLIRNIAHSLTDSRSGPISITEEGAIIRVRVLAADHFLPGVRTLYHFFIDSRLWLPERVEEATPSGKKKRVVAFFEVRTNTAIPDDFFRTDGAQEGSGG